MSYGFVCPVTIRIVMMVLLTSYWDGEYGFYTMDVGAIPVNGCGIEGQNYVALLQGTETTAGFHQRS